MTQQEIFSKCLLTDVNEHTEQKNGLTYLSWAWAWGEFTKIVPNATYKIDNANGCFVYGNSEIGYMVRTEITVPADDVTITREMWLPVMDFKNKTILNPTTFDINKAIMRCLTKNISMFGLGLYIYAGEDLPEQPKNYATPEQLKELKALDGFNETKILAWAKVKFLEELTQVQAQLLLDNKKGGNK